jgi:hypothetical protein
MSNLKIVLKIVKNKKIHLVDAHHRKSAWLKPGEAPTKT